jgi:hypothetical protein
MPTVAMTSVSPPFFASSRIALADCSITRAPRASQEWRSTCLLDGRSTDVQQEWC